VTGAELDGDDLARGLEVYPGERGLRVGARAVTAEQVRPPASHRLYRPIVTRHWVLDPGASPDQRTPVTP
jgi:hypothetical protein